jgi:HAD domain in Swiss Army Knife RNA repair proteins
MQQTRDERSKSEAMAGLQGNSASEAADRPLLFVDVDGVISVFGFEPGTPPPGSFHSIDGILHCISDSAGNHLARLSERFDLVWATGWEEKANEYLPHLLNLDGDLPVLTFGGAAVFGSAHWKLGAIEAYAGDRPAAWIDDFIDEECRRWAARRSAPTLLVETDSARGITEEDVEHLLDWAGAVAPGGGVVGQGPHRGPK